MVRQPVVLSARGSQERPVRIEHQNPRRDVARWRAANGSGLPARGKGRDCEAARRTRRPPDRSGHARRLRAGQGRDRRHRCAWAEVANFRVCSMHPGRDQSRQELRRSGRRRRNPGERPHDQERVRLVGGSRDEVVDRDDAGREGGRALHRLLHHRRDAHRAESIPRRTRFSTPRGK